MDLKNYTESEPRRSEPSELRRQTCFRASRSARHNETINNLCAPNNWNCHAVKHLTTSCWRQRPRCQVYVIDVMDNPFPKGPLFYSSGRGITVRLLLSVGAAGRTISPIWSKNLLADLPYVCCRPHDQRQQLELHMAAAVIPPWLGYQRRARRSQRRQSALVTQRPLLVLPAAMKSR